MKIVLFNCEDQTEVELERAMAKDAGIEVVLANDQSDDAIVEKCKDADGIITIYSPFTAEVLQQLPACQVIAVQAIGFNNLSLPGATQQGICLSNIPDYCLYDVALQTLALTLACARHVVPLNNRVKTGKWGYAGHTMHRLSGQTFGMVAFGNIPKRLAPMLQSTGMNIMTYDPWAKNEVLEEYGVTRANTLEELLAASDYVSVHCPLTDENRGIIGEKALSLMKPTAFLINTARGGLVDEKALYTALKNKQIAGAALDVLEKEGDGPNPLYELDNIVVTPHTAFYSEESTVDMRVKAMERVLAVLRDKTPPPNLLNPDVLGNARFQKA